MMNPIKNKLFVSTFMLLLLFSIGQVSVLAKSVDPPLKIKPEAIYGSIFDNKQNIIIIRLPLKLRSIIRKLGKEKISITISEIARSPGDKVGIYFLNPKENISISRKVLKVDLFENLLDISGVRFKPDSLQDGQYRLLLSVDGKTYEGAFEYKTPVVIAGNLNIDKDQCLEGVNSIVDTDGNILSRLVSLQDCSYLNEVLASKVKKAKTSDNKLVAFSKIITHEGIFFAPVELDATKNGEINYEVNLETTKNSAINKPIGGDSEEKIKVICSNLKEQFDYIQDCDEDDDCFLPPCLSEELETLCPEVIEEIENNDSCQTGLKVCSELEESDCIDISKINSSVSICSFCESDIDCAPQLSIETTSGCKPTNIACIAVLDSDSKEVKVCHINNDNVIHPATCDELPVVSAAVQCLAPEPPKCKISSEGKPKEGFDKRCCPVLLSDDALNLTSYLLYKKSSEVRYDSDEPKCGNGIKEGTEQCDDGNTNKGDGCSDKCQTEICGNGIKDQNEECDDGNQINTDECTNACKEAKCGDSIVQPLKNGEECDDGNTTKGDGCSDNCKLEQACGNGIKEGTEQCDDGNTSKGDGCNDKCQTEICGNGRKDEKEECDDGNQINTDECSNSCKEAKCGDSIVQPLKNGEQCDDGNTNENDGCDDECKIEVNITPIPTPTPKPSPTPSPTPTPKPSPTPGATPTPTAVQEPVCGNNKIEGNEQCDDGNTKGGDGCDSNCKIESTQTGTSFPGKPNVPIEACVFKILCSNVESSFAQGEFGKPKENAIELAIQQCRSLLSGSDRPSTLPPTSPSTTSTYVGGTEPNYPTPEGGIDPEFCIFHPKHPVCAKRSYERTSNNK